MRSCSTQLTCRPLAQHTHPTTSSGSPWVSLGLLMARQIWHLPRIGTPAPGGGAMGACARVSSSRTLSSVALSIYTGLHPRPALPRTNVFGSLSRAAITASFPSFFRRQGAFLLPPLETSRLSTRVVTFMPSPRGSCRSNTTRRAEQSDLGSRAKGCCRSSGGGATGPPGAPDATASARASASAEPLRSFASPFASARTEAGSSSSSSPVIRTSTSTSTSTSASTSKVPNSLSLLAIAGSGSGRGGGGGVESPVRADLGRRVGEGRMGTTAVDGGGGGAWWFAAEVSAFRFSRTAETGVRGPP